MAILNINLTLQAGEDFPGQTGAGFYFWQTGIPPLPVNLAGCTARMMIRDLFPDPNNALSITTTSNAQGVLTLGGGAGTIAISINKATTTALFAALPQNVNGSLAQGVYDLFIDFPNGTSTRFLQGTIIVTAAVTHP